MYQRKFVGKMLLCKLLVFVVLSTEVRGLPLSDALCHHTNAPVNSTKGVNRVSADNWDPLYKLELSGTDRHEYTVSIKLGSRFLPFSDAFISVETNGSCGTGQLIHEQNDFFHVDQPRNSCPILLTTNRKSVMQQLPPLRWKAPKCGCVHFRAMVLEASTIYYVEEPKVASGSLATTICIKGRGQQHKLSVEERTELLCKVTERFLGLEVLQRPAFLERRRLEPRYMDVHKTELALATRRGDVSACCQKTGPAKTECFRDIRRNRVDEFCEDGSPDIPFTATRSRFMREREEACCWRLGETRYSCFALEAGTEDGAWSADLSLDETDPLNDLGDYPDEIRLLEKEYGMVIFPADSPSTTPTTTTTSTTTTTTTTPAPPQEHPELDSARTTANEQKRKEPKFGGWSREELQLATEVAESPEDGRKGGWSRQVPTDFAAVDQVDSLEEFGQQNAGGSSIDKTFSKLQRRMWKLSLRTQCCQGGAVAAKATYGEFSAVWEQCRQSTDKYLQQLQLQHGHKACESQFQKCCMETAISTPGEVVTWKPVIASSREWDRDRHLVNSEYIPPYSRGPSSDTEALPPMELARASRERLVHPSQAAMTSAERRRGGVSALRSLPRIATSLVDEPEIDEEPQSKHQRSRRPSSKPRGSSSRERRLRQRNSRERLEQLALQQAEEEDVATTQQEAVASESERVNEDTVGARRLDELHEERVYQHSHERRGRKRSSRERSSGGVSRRRSGGRSRGGRTRQHETSAERRRQARLRFVEEPEIPEEPRLKKASRPESRPRGRSLEEAEKMNAAAGGQEQDDRAESASATNTQEQESRVENAMAKVDAAREREIETKQMEQLEHIFTEIAEDIKEDHEAALRETYEEEKGEERTNDDTQVDEENGADEDEDYSNDDDEVLEDDDDEEEVFDNEDDNEKDDDRTGRRAQSTQVASNAKPHHLANSRNTKHLQARWRAGFRSLENSGGVHSGGLSRRRRRKNHSGGRRVKPHRNHFASNRRMLNEALEEY